MSKSLPKIFLTVKANWRRSARAQLGRRKTCLKLNFCKHAHGKIGKKDHYLRGRHRAQSLTGAEDDVSCVWEAKDEVWDDLGLGHFDAAGVASLASSVQARRFLNYIEDEHREPHH